MENNEIKVDEERAKTFRDPALAKDSLFDQDPHKQIVYDKLYKCYREKPKRIVWGKRYELVSLNVQEWSINGEYSLFHGFCRIPCDLTVHFQATYEHVEKFYDTQYVADINKEIKSKYESLLKLQVAGKLEELWKKIFQAELTGSPSAAPAPDSPQPQGPERAPAMKVAVDEAETSQAIDYGETVDGHKARDETGPATPSGENELRVDTTVSNNGRPAQAANVQLLAGYSLAEAEIKKQVYTYLKTNKINCWVKCELRPPILKEIDGEKEKGKVTADFIYEDVFNKFAEKAGDFHRRRIEKTEGEKRKNKAKAEAEERKNKQSQAQDAEEMAKLEKHLRKNMLENEKEQNRHDAEMRRLRREEEKAIRQEQTDLEIFEIQESLRKLTDEIKLSEKDAAREESEAQFRLNLAKIEHQLKKLKAEGEVIRLKAENVMEYERQSELLKVLPQLIDKVGGNPQRIDHLSIMQVDPLTGVDGGDSNGPLKGGLMNPMFQVAQSIYLLKEILKQFKSSQQ
jgi:hypothetical protein